MTIDDLPITVALAWLLIGMAFAAFHDRRQMRQDVPYPNYPSGIPLRELRLSTSTVIALFWPFILATAMRRIVSHRRDKTPDRMHDKT
jgi:hypothetical protein